MKTKEQSRLNKFSAIIIISAILISNSIYGQARAVPESGTASPAANETVKVDTLKTAKTEYSFCRHEFLLWAGAGHSTMSYKPTFGDRDIIHFGGILGLGYTFYFNSHWGIGIGAEAALYNKKMNVDDLTDSYSIDDQDGDPIYYHNKIDYYTEKQRMYTVNIPLWLQFQTPLAGTKNRFYAALGFKLGIPFSAKYKSDDAQFDAYGYYEKWNQTLYDQRDLGYGANAGKRLEEDIDVATLIYMGMAEAGVKWSLSPRLNLYTGVYFDYGFNDVVKKDGNRFLEYNYQRPENFKTNSVLTSEYTSEGRTDDFTDRVSTVALGLKVRLGFNMCSSIEKEKKEKEEAKKKEAKPKSELETILEKLLEDRDKEPKGTKPAKRREVKLVVDDDNEEGDLAEKFADRVADRLADILAEKERTRVSSDYGKIVDIMVVQIDGYALNQSKLSPIMELMIDERMKPLQKYNSDKYTIICEGHTCDIGTAEANLKLAQSRAEEIVNYLVKNGGFNRKNLIATSKGKVSPIVPNIDEANRRINRRVVFLIKEK